MFTANQVLTKIRENRDWVLLSLLGSALYELGDAHTHTSNAHNYTAELAQEIMDTIATGNMTLIQALIPSLNETHVHCVHETAHHEDNANTSYLLAGMTIAWAGLSGLMMVRSFLKRSPTDDGYSSVNTGDSDLGGGYRPSN